MVGIRTYTHDDNITSKRSSFLGAMMRCSSPMICKGYKHIRVGEDYALAQ